MSCAFWASRRRNAATRIRMDSIRAFTEAHVLPLASRQRGNGGWERGGSKIRTKQIWVLVRPPKASERSSSAATSVTRASPHWDAKRLLRNPTDWARCGGGHPRHPRLALRPTRKRWSEILARCARRDSGQGRRCMCSAWGSAASTAIGTAIGSAKRERRVHHLRRGPTGGRGCRRRREKWRWCAI